MKKIAKPNALPNQGESASGVHIKDNHRDICLFFDKER